MNKSIMNHIVQILIDDEIANGDKMFRMSVGYINFYQTFMPKTKWQSFLWKITKKPDMIKELDELVSMGIIAAPSIVTWQGQPNKYSTAQFRIVMDPVNLAKFKIKYANNHC
jgi:hypothetical protein